MSVRVRFAPSPTGYLHIGGARTALFNWLFARHTGGTFILRIEDTDVARNTREAVDVILEGLQWLGLEWDEGPTSSIASDPGKGEYGPYFQTQRREIYRRRVDDLIAKGLAYAHEGAIKFKMRREPIVFTDLVVGEVKRELTDREEVDPDFVIVRSDGLPVFHLVNVIDDLEMRITHVIRGEDHLSNTAKHIALFRALGAEPPKYAHIPLILNPDGSKMSKRDAGASLSTYIERGYVSEAVANYLCLLGWSPKDNREILSMAEVSGIFDLPHILRHNARFDQIKLDWMNYEYIRTMELDRFVRLASEILHRSGVPLQQYDRSYVSAALATCQEKVKVLSDLSTFAGFYFIETVQYDPTAARKDFTMQNEPRLERLKNAVVRLEPFDASGLEQTLKQVAGDLGVKPSVLIHPLRLACTGQTIGPSLYHLMEVLGKERVLRRLDAALAFIRSALGAQPS